MSLVTRMRKHSFFSLLKKFSVKKHLNFMHFSYLTFLIYMEDNISFE